MKKILLVVAMLIIASPVLATVSVTATDKGSGVVEVKYNCSAAEKVRAFALDITVDSGAVINNIRDFNTGESKKPGGGYGIFPGRFADYINAASPNWADINYNPVAPSADPNAKSGLGTNAITVELGTLYVDVNAPGTSGMLFRLDVNGNGASDCNLSIAVNGTRGSIVLEDASLAPSPVLTGTKVTFPPTCVTILNEVGVAKATAEAAWTGQGFTLGVATAVVDCTKVGLIISHDTGCKTLPYAVNYSYGIQATVPNVVGMTRAAAIAAINAANGNYVMGTEVNVACDGLTPVGNVCSQNPVAGTLGCGTTIVLSIVSYPIKDSAPNSMYTNWLGRGRPACWAYPRQCHGDADGKKVGTWVSSGDLTILRSAITKVDSLIPAGGICADFDHKKVGTWVSSGDLTILRQYITKLDTAVPVCGNTSVTTDPNYWYFCVPTGVTCPAGQVCAPAGTCPNTP